MKLKFIIAGLIITIALFANAQLHGLVNKVKTKLINHFVSEFNPGKVLEL